MHIRIGSHKHISFHDEHEIHEFKTPKQNRNLHIFITCFLSIFVAALIFGLVVVVQQTIPGELSYSYVETVDPGKVHYDIEIIAKDDDYRNPQKFEVNIEGSNGATYSKTVTDYQVVQDSDEYYVYKFRVTIDSSDGATAWMYADGIRNVFLVDREDGEFNEAKEVVTPGEMLPAYIIIPIFLIVIIVIMIINIKQAIKWHKKAKEEAAGISSEPAPRKTLGNMFEEAIEKSLSSSNGSTTECPYCHVQNKIGSAKCQGCGAPIRKV